MSTCRFLRIPNYREDVIDDITIPRMFGPATHLMINFIQEGGGLETLLPGSARLSRGRVFPSSFECYHGQWISLVSTMPSKNMILPERNLPRDPQILQVGTLGGCEGGSCSWLQ